MIKVSLQNYDEFTRKIWAIVVDKTINKWVREATYKLEGLVKKKQLDYDVHDTWMLGRSYKTDFKSARFEGELQNFRKYWIFQHEGFSHWRGGQFIVGRPWFTDTLDENKNLPKEVIEKNLYQMLTDIWIQL